MPDSSAAGSGTRRRDAGDRGTSSRSADAIDGTASPQRLRGELPHGLLAGWCRVGRPLQSIAELLDRQPRFANERPERPLGNALMIRNDEAAVWTPGVPQDKVASALAIHLVSQAFERANRLRTRDTG